MPDAISAATFGELRTREVRRIPFQLDFSQLAEKGVGYARHRSSLKEVSDAHPTHPDDTGFAPVRATLLQARLPARSGAPGWREPRSGREDGQFRPTGDGLGPTEVLPPLPPSAQPCQLVESEGEWRAVGVGGGGVRARRISPGGGHRRDLGETLR